MVARMRMTPTPTLHVGSYFFPVSKTWKDKIRRCVLIGVVVALSEKRYHWGWALKPQSSPSLVWISIYMLNYCSSAMPCILNDGHGLIL